VIAKPLARIERKTSAGARAALRGALAGAPRGIWCACGRQDAKWVMIIVL
jgi:hypothetical protein